MSGICLRSKLHRLLSIRRTVSGLRFWGDADMPAPDRPRYSRLSRHNFSNRPPACGSLRLLDCLRALEEHKTRIACHLHVA